MNQNPSHYQISNNRDSFNVTTITNHTTIIEDERGQILSWLSPLKSGKRHRDVAGARAKGVGDWVLKTAEFQAWQRDADGQPSDTVLFCRGVPGAGKTFVCSLVIDTLCETASQNVVVACLYCDYRGQKEQTPAGMIGDLLKQFVIALPKIPKEIVEAFLAAQGHIGGRVPQLSQILGMFPRVLACFRQAFICVDALDELVVEHRVEFLCGLCEILEKSPNTRLFLTGRSHIQPELESRIPCSISVISIQLSMDDIKSYLETKLASDPDPEAMDASLRQEIMTKITQEFSEVFLLVALQIDSILGEVTVGRRRQKLHEMTNGLGDAYSATLDRIKRQRGAKARLGIAALMWISFAERPLLVDELGHALAVEVGSRDINTGLVPSIETIVGSCMGLVAIDCATATLTVRLVHATLQEYLRSHHENIFESPHATIAEACLSYLGLQSVLELSPDLYAAPRTLPLVSYASSYWGSHARKELTASVKGLALGVLERYPEKAAVNIFLLNGGAPWTMNIGYEGFSGLHYVAYFGIDELMEALLSIGCSNLNQTDQWCRTPLNLAAANGHEGIVRILLDQPEVNPDISDQFGHTPLILAIRNGHGGVVKALLDRASLDPGVSDHSCRVSLFLAARYGHEGVVKILLDRGDLNPNPVNENGKTPLSLAAEEGHERVVKMLLDRADVNPDSEDHLGRPPLSFAAEQGHEGVVKMLVARTDVNPDLKDQFGRTPLSWAARNGHEGVVKILLGQAVVYPNSVDEDGQAPLFLAAKYGHEAVVKILLDRPDVKPDIADHFGRTPLLSAARNGHGGMVGILLDRADVNPHLADGDGRTPLFLAAKYGHEGVVKALLDLANSSPDSTDRWGKTPLSLAAECGHQGVLKILLGRADVNPDVADNFGRKPLSSAAKNGHEGVIEILLNRADVSPNPVDEGGQTPLFLAAKYRHEGLVKMLLDQSNVDPNVTNNFGQTPLSSAARNGHEGVVKILLGQPGVNPKIEDHFGRSALSFAAEEGHEGVVEALLGRVEVNPDLPDHYGRSPLSFASEKGHEGVVKLLLHRPDVNPDSTDQFERTPLSWAAENGNEGVAELLLDRADVNPNSPDEDGHTPLFFAIWNGREGVVKILHAQDVSKQIIYRWQYPVLALPGPSPLRTLPSGITGMAPVLAMGQAGPWAFVSPWAGPVWAKAHESPWASWWPVGPVGFYQILNSYPKLEKRSKY